MKKSTSLFLLSTIFTISGSLPTFWSDTAMAMEVEDKDDATKVTFVKTGAKKLLKVFNDINDTKKLLDKMKEAQVSLDNQSMQKYGAKFHKVSVNDREATNLQRKSQLNLLKATRSIMIHHFKKLTEPAEKEVKPIFIAPKPSPSNLLYSNTVIALDESFNEDMDVAIASVKALKITTENKEEANEHLQKILKTAFSKYEKAHEWQLSEELVKYRIAQLYKVFGDKLDEAFKEEIGKLEAEMEPSSH